MCLLPEYNNESALKKRESELCVGREEIKEIAQRSEVKGSENDIEAGLDRARSTDGQSPVDRPIERCARRAQT